MLDLLIRKLIDSVPQALRILSARDKALREDLNRLNVVGDPSIIRREYVVPNAVYGHPFPPPGFGPEKAAAEPVVAVLSDFLTERVRSDDGRNTLFILSDAGMGKTMLLAMLRMKALLPRHARISSVKAFRIHRDIATTLNEIPDSDKSQMLLLLDALDEDPSIGDPYISDSSINARMRSLLRICTKFKNVIITCRLQFFPDLEYVRTTAGVPEVDIGGYHCRVSCILPFTDAQTNEFLVRRGRTSQEISDVLAPFRRLNDLRCRPLILSYIDLLVDKGGVPNNIYALFDHIAREWISRECRRLAKVGFPDVDPDLLLLSCSVIAAHLQDSTRLEGTTIQFSELAEVLSHELKEKHKIDVAGEFFQGLTAGTLSLMNRTSDRRLRFSHLLFQEFFATRRVLSPNVDRRRIRVSAPMVEFIVAFLALRTNSEGVRLVLDGLQLAGANFANRHLRDLSLRDADLQRADLSGTNLENVDLSSAFLVAADLKNAHLQRVFFETANLGCADLRCTTFEDCNFSGAWVNGAHLCGAVVAAGGGPRITPPISSASMLVLWRRPGESWNMLSARIVQILASPLRLNVCTPGIPPPHDLIGSFREDSAAQMKSVHYIPGDFGIEEIGTRLIVQRSRSAEPLIDCWTSYQIEHVDGSVLEVRIEPSFAVLVDKKATRLGKVDSSYQVQCNCVSALAETRMGQSGGGAKMHYYTMPATRIGFRSRETAIGNIMTLQHNEGEPEAAKDDAVREAYYQEVFEEFVKFKLENNESTDGLTYNAVAARLRRHTTELMKRPDARDVQFSVYLKDRQVAIKARIIRYI